MKGIINLLRVLLIGVWGLALTVCVSLYFDAHSPRQLPGGHAPWTVADSAMEPSYCKGDLAILNMKQAAKPGDAVLVKGEAGPLFRRIIGVTEDQYIFKGDGGEESFLAGPQAVTGVCVAYLPGCGVFIQPAGHSPSGRCGAGIDYSAREAKRGQKGRP